MIDWRNAQSRFLKSWSLHSRTFVERPSHSAASRASASRVIGPRGLSGFAEGCRPCSVTLNFFPKRHRTPPIKGGVFRIA